MNAAQEIPIPESTATPALPVTAVPANSESATVAVPIVREIGGRGGLEPTRYGDWEKAGRCIDF
jgi:hypothetical protein